MVVGHHWGGGKYWVVVGVLGSGGALGDGGEHWVMMGSTG